MSVNQTLLFDAYSSTLAPTSMSSVNGSLLFDSNFTCEGRDLVVRQYVFSPALYISRRYIFPIQFAIGCSTNFLNFIVLNSRGMRTKTNNFLASMALADMLFFLMMFPLTFTSFEPFASSFAYMAFYYNVNIPLFAFANSFSAASIWLTVAVTLERAVAVRFPLHARSYLTGGRVLWTIFLIYLFAFIINVHHFVARTPVIDSLQRRRVCKNCTECSYFFNYANPTNSGYATTLYLKVAIYASTVLVILVPLILIAVLNGVLLNFLRRHRHDMVGKRASDSQYRAAADAQLSREHKNEMKVTWTVVVIIVAFLVLNVPSGIVQALELILQSGIGKMPRDLLEGAEACNILVTTGKMINFFLYCFASASFRQRLANCLCRGNRLLLQWNREKHHQYLSRTSITSCITTPVNRSAENMQMTSSSYAHFLANHGHHPHPHHTRRSGNVQQQDSFDRLLESQSISLNHHGGFHEPLSPTATNSTSAPTIALADDEDTQRQPLDTPEGENREAMAKFNNGHATATSYFWAADTDDECDQLGTVTSNSSKS